MDKRSVYRKWVCMGVLACLGLGLTGCPGGILGVVDQSNNGGSYRLVFGSTMEVRLASDPDASCAWFISNINQNFLRRIDNANTNAPASRKTLDDGTQVSFFQFQGVAQSTSQLGMRELCGDSETPTGDTFSIRVDVVGLGI